MMPEGIDVKLSERDEEDGRPGIILGVRPEPDAPFILRELTSAEAKFLESALQHARWDAARIRAQRHGYECPNCGANVERLLSHRFVVGYDDSDARAWACNGKATKR